MALAGMTQEETNVRNENHCKYIAETVEAYAHGEIYRCPECSKEIQLPDDVGDKYRCPDCCTVHNVDDLEQLSLWDYMSDALDFRFLLNSDREVIAVKILVAFGGPNIWIDTETRSVNLYWWTDQASYPLSYAVCDDLDEWAQEYFNC